MKGLLHLPSNIYTPDIRRGEPTSPPFRRISLLFIILILLLPSYAGAETPTVTSPPTVGGTQGETQFPPARPPTVTSPPSEEKEYEEPVYLYEFPEIAPELFIKPQYLFLGHKGSVRAGEFQYLQSSLGSEIFLKAFPFPHRIHLEFEVLNKEDFYGDIRYAYKDLLLLRGLTRGLYHNLDNILLIDPGPSDRYTVQQMDQGRRYGTSNSISSLLLRLKAPDYPFHLFIDTLLIKRDGSIQQRFLSSYLPLNRVALPRNIEWESRSVTVGTNAHVGPIEVELTRMEKRLDVGGERILENIYGDNLYPHNLMPDLRGSTTTLKIHTSYTGQIVAAATLSKTERKNETSGTKAEYTIAAGDLQYMPHPNLTFFLRYRHRKADTDNPEFIPVNYLGYPAYSSAISVRPSISSTTDSVAGTVRYRVMRGLTLYGEYSGERIERENSREWKLPKETVKNTFSLSANIRPLNSLEFKTKFIHQEIDAPAYNNEADRSDEARFSLNGRPLKWMSGLFMYSIALQKRKELNYIDDNSLVKTGERDIKRERFFGSLNLLLTERLTLSPIYSYIRNRTIQDILYNNTGTTPEYHLDRDVLYRDTSHIFGVTINYLPLTYLNTGLDLTYTISRGRYLPGVLTSDLLSIKELEPEADIREAGLTLRADYEIKKGLEAGVRYSFVDYNDRRNDSQDGELHTLIVSLSKRW